MSGVGSTNAMKKGSANNPFLAYSEADMQDFLNSAYTGCIVKYTGPSTKTAVPRGNGLSLGDAQNLVVDLTKSFTYNQGSSKSRSWYITIESETGNKCIMDITINKQTGVIGTPTLISDTIKALIYSIYTPYSSIIGRNINDLDVKFLSVTGTDVDRDVVTNWPITYGKNGWQSDCFNDSGKITLWGYGEKVTAIQNQNDMDYWSAYPILYTEPYVANVLYKVVYSNGQYYFEEFYHISENVTTATVEDVAPGKTFYDFTGTKQTGTGTKINPYIASTADEMATYLTSSYKGAFVKYIGETVAVGGTSASLPFGSSGGNFADVAGATGVYLNHDLDATAIKTALTNSGNADASVVYLPNADSETMFMLYIKNDNDVLIICKMDEATNTYVPFYAEQAGTYKNTYFSGGFENIPTDGNVAGFIPLVFYTPSEEIAAIFDLFVSKTPFTSGGGESYVKNAIYQVAEDGDTTRYAILPTLSNPGTAADLAQGKQLIDGDGKVVEGEAEFSFGDYSVKVIDYDGTVLTEKKGNTGDVIDLPTAPTHDKLVFQGWSASVSVSNNKVTIADNDIMVGAVYTTASGKNEFDITLTKVTGLSVTLNMDGTKDWGDGTSDTANTHTYTAYGDYTIKCNGTITKNVFGSTDSAPNYYCKKARLVTNIVTNAFYDCFSLNSITLSNVVTKVGTTAFYNCMSLTNVIIPNSVISVGISAFQNCHSLSRILIPNSITNIENSIFDSCYSLDNIILPNSVTIINPYAFANCYSLQSIIIPDGVTEISTYVFSHCYSLNNIVLPDSVTIIGNGAFAYCYSLTNIILPNSITQIKDYAFQGCYSLIKYDFSQCSSVPTLSNVNVFNNINKICKIIVPDSLYDEWIAAPRWIGYSSYIYKASEEVTQ